MTEPELIARIALTVGLCSIIGFEREVRQKAAGLRTHTLVGVGSAVAMMVSKYGFDDVVTEGLVRLDPSRVAGQIVSGIGFIGAGLIFVRRDRVQGLTTAAVVWLAAMVGMAVGAGMYLLAAAATVAHLIVAAGFPMAERLLPRTRWTPSQVRFTYADGKGVLRRVLAEITDRGFTVANVDVDRASASAGHVCVSLQVFGRGSRETLASDLEDIEGIYTVAIGDELSS